MHGQDWRGVMGTEGTEPAARAAKPAPGPTARSHAVAAVTPPVSVPLGFLAAPGTGRPGWR